MVDIKEIIALLHHTLDYQGQPIALHEPSFTGNEWRYVKECLDTGWVSSVGKFVDRFEIELAAFTGAKHAVATTNGTAALHIAFKLAGVKANDEVLVPTLTFVATVNAINYCQGIPHFIEAEDKTLGIDVDKLADYLADITQRVNNTTINKITQRPIRALCVMHTLGHPVDLDAIIALCDRYQLALIEDAAEALGSYYKNVHVGHKGLMGTLSFNGNKIMTTGGGGAIITNDTALAKHAKHITTTAKIPHAYRFTHDEIGYNYRLPNINAALGCAQLEQLPKFLQAKRLLAETYQKGFANVKGMTMIKEPSYAKSNYWINAMLLDSAAEPMRDQVLNDLAQAGILGRPLWDLQHQSKMYHQAPHMPLTVAENIANRLIQIPSSASLITSKIMATSS